MMEAELSAKYVLFDSWFSSPKAVTALKQGHGLDTIAMVKKSSKIKYDVLNCSENQNVLLAFNWGVYCFFLINQLSKLSSFSRKS